MISKFRKTVRTVRAVRGIVRWILRWFEAVLGGVLVGWVVLGIFLQTSPSGFLVFLAGLILLLRGLPGEGE